MSIGVSTSRCGRDDPGSNPGDGIFLSYRSLIFLVKRPQLFPLFNNCLRNL